MSETVKKALTAEMFEKRYSDLFKGTSEWQAIETSTGETYSWDDKSTYIQNPPFFEGMGKEPGDFSDIQ